MDRFQCNIEVDAAPSVCYQKWHHFEQFPHFMDHVEEVRQLGDKRWHWVVSGPMGNRSEWDAEIDSDEPNRLISWHSVSGSELTISGLVNFIDLGQNKTQITCEIQYEPPGGIIGEAVAHLFTHPDKMVQENLTNFKHLVEGTNVPVEKVHTGRHMEPNPFVVSGQTTPGQANTAENNPTTTANKPDEKIGSTNEEPVISDHAFRSVETGPDVSPSHAQMEEAGLDDEGYELIYGLEDEMPHIGTSADLPRADIEEIERLNEQESPYVGLSQGAIYSEDLIDMRDDSFYDTRKTDIYAESMDVFDEDLASFTENIDSDIDIGLGSVESVNPFDPNAPDRGLGPREVSQSAEDRQTSYGLPDTEKGD